MRYRICRFPAAARQIGIWRADGRGIELPVIASQCAHWRGNLHRIPESETSYAVGASLDSPGSGSGCFLNFYWRKGTIIHHFIPKLACFSDRSRPAPTRWNDTERYPKAERFQIGFVTAWVRALPGGRVKTRPYNWMTIGGHKNDGDSHTSVRTGS